MLLGKIYTFIQWYRVFCVCIPEASSSIKSRTAASNLHDSSKLDLKHGTGLHSQFQEVDKISDMPKYCTSKVLSLTTYKEQGRSYEVWGLHTFWWTMICSICWIWEDQMTLRIHLLLMWVVIVSWWNCFQIFGFCQLLLHSCYSSCHHCISNDRKCWQSYSTNMWDKIDTLKLGIPWFAKLHSDVTKGVLPQQFHN